jgi:broad specificity phosphatase PhoE
MTRLILVRHAQSAANRDGVGLGRADSPLTDLGERQAAALGAALASQRIDRIIASPLQRARSTAKAIATAQPSSKPRPLTVDVDDRLVEMDVGELDGLAWPVVQERYGGFVKRWLSDDASETKMPGGESLAEVARRAWPSIESLIKPAAGDRNEVTDLEDNCIAVVSHNFVLRTLVCRVLELQLNRWRNFELDLASRSTVERVRGRPVLVDLNETSHLVGELHIVNAPRAGRTRRRAP